MEVERGEDSGKEVKRGEDSGKERIVGRRRE